MKNRRRHNRDEIYTLLDYYEGLFKFRHEINEMYNEPLMPWWAYLLFMLLIIGSTLGVILWAN